MDNKVITKFFNEVDSDYLYNEASVQFELGWYLRKEFPDTKIQLERNIYHLNLPKTKFIKSEIDILISNSKNKFSRVIEIKAPINQIQVRPVTVFNWIKDIRFLEQLKIYGISGYSIFITDNKGYLEGSRNTKILLTDFRSRKIHGTYRKHLNTKYRNETIDLNNEYTFEWNEINNKLFYFITESK